MSETDSNQEFVEIDPTLLGSVAGGDCVNGDPDGGHRDLSDIRKLRADAGSAG